MQADTLFKAMGDQTRRRTLCVLRRHELSVSELVEVLRQPQSTVSRHLKILRDASLIQDRREGNVILYSVPATPNGSEESDLTRHLMGWIGEQPLLTSLAERLDMVVQERREMSSRFFDRVGRQWDALREESFGGCFHLEAFLSLVPQTWAVADIGTGTGYLLPALARHFRHVIAVEPADRMLEAARNRIATYGLDNVDLREGELEHLPIKEAGVNLAIAMLVLHHVPSPRDALAELFRVVRPGGVTLLVEQASHHNEAFRDRMQDRWWGFDSRELVGWLEVVGFEQVLSRKLVTVDSGDDAPELFVVSGRKATVSRFAPNQDD